MDESIVALCTVIIAMFLWRIVFGIPFMQGYGVGQRKTKGLHTLFMAKEELRGLKKQKKAWSK